MHVCYPSLALHLHSNVALQSEHIYEHETQMHYQWQNKHIINGIMYYLFIITFTVLQITTMKTQMHYQWQYKHIINGIMYYLFIIALPVFANYHKCNANYAGCT